MQSVAGIKGVKSTSVRRHLRRTFCREFSSPLCPYRNHREKSRNLEYYGTCSLSLQWQFALKRCLNECNYCNTNPSNVSLAVLIPSICFLYTVLPPCTGNNYSFQCLCMVSNTVTMIIFSTSRYFQFGILFQCCNAGVA